MASSVLRWISGKEAAETRSLRWAAGIFRPPSCRTSKLCTRIMMSTMSVNPKESSSTLPSRISPWLMLPPAFEGGGDMFYKFYSLAEKTVLSIKKRSGEVELESPDDDAEFVGSSHGWLALYNRGNNNDLFLSNPLSRRHIKLPPVHTLFDPERNLLNCGHGRVSKVIISCSPDEEGGECCAMMAYGPEDRLAFCWPGCSTEWTPISASFRQGKTPRTEVMTTDDDFVYSSRQKLFFCIPEDEDLEGWDLSDPQSPRIYKIGKELEFDEKNYPWHASSEEQSTLKKLCRQLRYLVFSEQSNELYLVTRHIMRRMGPDGSPVKDIFYGMYRGWDESYPYKTIAFDVHKIDREGGKLRYMEGFLDGMVMFIGMNHSFAMSAAEFPELRPNSIYFTEDKVYGPRGESPSLDKSYGGHDIGIFNYENRTVSSCYYPCDVRSVENIVPAPMWFTPVLH